MQKKQTLFGSCRGQHPISSLVLSRHKAMHEMALLLLLALLTAALIAAGGVRELSPLADIRQPTSGHELLIAGSNSMKTFGRESS